MNPLTRPPQPAIAAAIALRSYLLVGPPSDGGASIVLDFPDIGLHHAWQAASLPWSAFASKNQAAAGAVTVLDAGLVELLQPFLDAVSPSKAESVRTVHRHAAAAFLYILLSLENPASPARTYTMRSTIPIASGLGSSASVSVCIATAVLMQTGRLPAKWSASPDSQDKSLELINQWAFVGELCIHGTPSGIDNTVATRGKAVLFKRNQPPAAPSVTLLHDFPTLPLLVVDTNQPRSTAIEVAKVAALKEIFPQVTESILDAIGRISSEVVETIKPARFQQDRDASVVRLGQLIRVNHNLLASLGVSHPKLERIRQIVDDANLGWTKLTGAGGGGCAFALTSDDMTPEALKAVEASLDKEGYRRYETSLGAPGVALVDISAASSSFSESDSAAFRDVQSASDLEALIGVTSSRMAGTWQYLQA